ncbi:hypothetical protein [Allochromatium palmeri]|uniref:Uncharacterized protein n=1 Tax=Allochromatium palmeri TaxID=231048 RepID=A0A6N8EHP5_9GAMM|nr:hypothetical protein [Allochromatium palmeri]MTW22568.1 hypothetical protein [Allochromatium palmeri]
MSTALLLFGWMSLNGLVGWRPDWLGRWSSRLALGLMLLTLFVSEFWRQVVNALLSREAPLLAGPEAAYVSVWILVLLPILRRRLDVRTLSATLLSGLTAAAAFGLALDSAPLITAGFASAGLQLEAFGQLALTVVVHACLAGAGLAMRQLMEAEHTTSICEQFHWEYAAIYAGLISMHQAIA